MVIDVTKGQKFPFSGLVTASDKLWGGQMFYMYVVPLSFTDPAVSVRSSSSDKLWEAL